MVCGIPTTLTTYTTTIKKEEPVQFLVGWVNNIPIIKTFSTNNFSHAKQLLHLAKRLYSKAYSAKNNSFRFCSNQIHSMEFEWNAVELQHAHLLQTKQSLIHLCSLLEIQSFETILKKKTVIDITALQALPKLFNTPGWLQYCAWYNAQLNKEMTKFHYDATMYYTLESDFQHFDHETHSYFLQSTLQHVNLLEKTMENGDISYKALLQKNKELMLSRKKLQDMLFEQNKILLDIVNHIQQTADLSNTFSDLLFKGTLLQTLLSCDINSQSSPPLHFGAQQILLQLLHDEYQVLSHIHCNNKFYTNIAFSIRLATRQIRTFFSKELIADLAYNWNTTIQDNSKKAGKRMKTLEQFRQCFIQNLGNTETETLKKQTPHLNPEIAELFPK